MKSFLRAATAAAALVALPSMATAQHHANKEKAMQPVKNIVQVAVEAGTFNTLVKAVKAAGLAETLQGAGPFTVFAPTDEAFSKLPAGTLDALLADKDKLVAVLTYHVVPARVMSMDVVKNNGARPKTVNGEMLDVEVRDGKVFVDGALVTKADIVASNGIIHVIDSVVLPNSMTTASGSR